MDKTTISPETFEERVVWWAIIGTYGFYLLGALYVVAPAMGWTLLGYCLVRLWCQTDITPAAQRIVIPTGVWLWMIGMLCMEVVLLMGHLDYDLNLTSFIKSSIGWAKGWALLGIFPLIGCLNIRPQVIYRAAAIVCAQSLVLLPLFVAAPYIGLPESLYVSPLSALGGPGPEFFEVSLYGINPADGQPRWRLFTPWAPALGVLANVYFIFALQEQSRKWFWLGVIGSVAMVLVSKSRLGLVCLASVAIGTWVMFQLTRAWLFFALAAVSTVAGAAVDYITDTFDLVRDQFVSARADSSRVRAALARIAIERWRSEAPLWGHGIVEKGPHLVEHMLIGSHHTWYGLLFVKGVAGLVALAVPMIYSFIDLLIKGYRDQTARVAFSMMLILFLYTFGENLEILAYLIWPAMIIIGVGARSRTSGQNLQARHEVCR